MYKHSQPLHQFPFVVDMKVNHPLDAAHVLQRNNRVENLPRLIVIPPNDVFFSANELRRNLAVRRERNEPRRASSVNADEAAMLSRVAITKTVATNNTAKGR